MAPCEIPQFKPFRYLTSRVTTNSLTLSCPSLGSERLNGCDPGLYVATPPGLRMWALVPAPSELLSPRSCCGVQVIGLGS